MKNKIVKIVFINCNFSELYVQNFIRRSLDFREIRF
jgi:hypothetical protein